MAFPFSYSQRIDIATDLSDPHAAAEVLRAGAALLRVNDRMEVIEAPSAVRFRQRGGYARATSNPPQPSPVSNPDRGVLEIMRGHPRPTLRLTVGSHAAMLQSAIVIVIVIAIAARDVGFQSMLLVVLFGWSWLMIAFHIRRVLRVQSFVKRNAAQFVPAIPVLEEGRRS